MLRVFRFVLPVLVFFLLLSPSSVNALADDEIELSREELKTRYGQENVTYDDPKSCYRTCGDEPRICYYEFRVENYDTMSGLCGGCAYGTLSDCFNEGCVTADGYERNIMSVNRQIPGMSIDCCKNDLIIVEVLNHLAGSELTVHWHGLHQKETPWMDGVPMVTQCPISSGNSFRYKFYAREPGTHYYHAHSGLHRTNGVVGKFNVRENPSEDPNAQYYDYDLEEHSILLSDWNHYLAEEKAPGVRSERVFPESFLINGYGNYFDEKTKDYLYAPMAAFRVAKGKRYRFRLDNAGSQFCPMDFRILGHNLTVIATDGYSVEPVIVDRIVIGAGERYDFVLHASNDTAINETLIVLRTLGGCEHLKLQEIARVFLMNDVPDYTTSLNEHEPLPKSARPDYDIEEIPKKILNSPYISCNDPQNVCVASLQQKGLKYPIGGNMRDTLSHPIEKVIPLRIVNYFLEDRRSHYLTFGDLVMVGTINNISSTGSTVPGLTQPDSFIPYCDEDNLPSNCNSSSICHCPHLIQLDYCKVYEFLLLDNNDKFSPVAHPMHLHGHGFQVVNMGTLDELVAGETAYAKSTALPVVKDTVLLPAGSFMQIRFKSCNPGYWFFHCHFEYHMHNGMSATIRVGDKSNMVAPPSGFPTCGDFF